MNEPPELKSDEIDVATDLLDDIDTAPVPEGFDPEPAPRVRLPASAPPDPA